MTDTSDNSPPTEDELLGIRFAVALLVALFLGLGFGYLRHTTGHGSCAAPLVVGIIVGLVIRTPRGTSIGMVLPLGGIPIALAMIPMSIASAIQLHERALGRAPTGSDSPMLLGATIGGMVPPLVIGLVVAVLASRQWRGRSAET